MQGGTRLRRALLVGLVACGLTGCLPAGGPPTGQRWLSGRTLGFFFQFAPDAAGAAPTILVTDGSPDSELDLYHVTDPGPTGSSAATTTAAQGGKLLLSNVLTWGGGELVCFAADCRLSQDAGGRVLVPQVLPPMGYSSSWELFRLDLTTDTALDLGPESSFAMSPSGERLVLESGSTATVYDADDGQMALPNAETAQFVGEDLYWLEGDGNPADFMSATLHELAATGTDETLLQDVQSLQVSPAGTGQLLFLSQVDAAGNHASSLLDPTTHAQTPLPDNGTYQSASSDGTWLQLLTFPGGSGPAQNELFDASTGVAQPIGAANQGNWRPGHDEFWVVPYSEESAATVQIWQAGVGMTTTAVAGEPVTYSRVGDNGDTLFTADGRHWFSFVPDSGNRGQIFVGTADDLTALTFPVNPVGTGPGQYWQLADGRLLVEAFITDQNRNDIYLVDPDSGETRELASGGHVVMVGPTRAMVLLDWVTSAGIGDLTLIAFDSGDRTLLGQNVSSVAFQQHPDPADPAVDPLAPGADVAFLVHDLIDSPYDGIWVVALP